MVVDGAGADHVVGDAGVRDVARSDAVLAVVAGGLGLYQAVLRCQRVLILTFHAVVCRRVGTVTVAANFGGVGGAWIVSQELSVVFHTCSVIPSSHAAGSYAIAVESVLLSSTWSSPGTMPFWLASEGTH